MKALLVVGMIAAGSGILAAQEKEIPKDSELVTVRGCANGRNFVVAPRSEDQPGTLEIEPGRRLRLNGPGKLLDEIKKRERMMVEVTGLMKKSQIAESGIAIAGGRIRIGGGVPRSPMGDPRTDPAYNQTILDVSSYRPLPDPCPDR